MFQIKLSLSFHLRQRCHEAPRMSICASSFYTTAILWPQSSIVAETCEKSGLPLRACSSPIDNDCSWGSWEASSLYLVIYEDTIWTKRCSVTLHWSERIGVRRVCLSVRASPASKKLCQLHASIPTLMAVCNAHTARTCFLLLIHFKVVGGGGGVGWSLLS